MARVIFHYVQFARELLRPRRDGRKRRTNGALKRETNNLGRNSRSQDPLIVSRDSVKLAQCHSTKRDRARSHRTVTFLFPKDDRRRENSQPEALLEPEYSIEILQPSSDGEQNNSRTGLIRKRSRVSIRARARAASTRRRILVLGKMGGKEGRGEGKGERERGKTRGHERRNEGGNHIPGEPW